MMVTLRKVVVLVMMLLMMQTMMGEATIQQVAFSFNDLWSSPIGFHRLRLQSDNSTERSRSIQTENKQHHTLQRTEDRVESGCISSWMMMWWMW